MKRLLLTVVVCLFVVSASSAYAGGFMLERISANGQSGEIQTVVRNLDTKACTAIYVPEQNGKSILAMLLMLHAQKEPFGLAIYMDKGKRYYKVIELRSVN